MTNYMMWRCLTLLFFILFVILVLPMKNTDGASHTVDNVLDFFPESNGDGLNIIWDHAVNSHAQIDAALSGDTMMLETDVILRGIGTPNQTDIPVNAHPPDTDSDLMVVDFVNLTTSTAQKGMKLDFKYIEAVGPTMEIIMEFEDQLNCPLWINADIAVGPNSPKDPIPPIEFITSANSYFSETVMSLGFTTDYGPLKKEDMYTWTMVFDILQYTYPLHPQPVTYPIRAIWSVRSWPKFTWLLGLRDSFSITVWTGSADPVDVQGLVSFRTHGDIKRIYYDLPKYMRNQFLEAMSSGSPEPDEKPHTEWNRNAWNSYTSSSNGNFVFMSTESLGIYGTAQRAGFVQASAQHQPKGDTPMEITGTIQFVDRHEGHSNTTSLEIHIRARNVSDPTGDGYESTWQEKDAKPGDIFLIISASGNILLGGKDQEALNRQLPPAYCYNFSMTDYGDKNQVGCTVEVITCADAGNDDTNEGMSVTMSFSESPAYTNEQQFYVSITKLYSEGDILVENLHILGSKTPNSSTVFLGNTLMIMILVGILNVSLM